MGRMVYVAYPIDQASSGDLASRGFFSFVEDTMSDLMETGAVDIMFDPGEAFTIRQGTPVSKEVGVLNRNAAQLADYMVAFLPSGVPSIGVPMEIDRAVANGKVVAIFTDVTSWMLDYNSPLVRVFPMSRDGVEQAGKWMRSTSPDQRDRPDPLPVVLLDDGGRLPTRGYHDDAGLDLYVSQDVVVPVGQAMDVPCAVAVELPEWSWGLILGRSSARRSHGLLVHPGVIDAGWRGPLFAFVENTTKSPVAVRAGSRIAQLIVMPNLTKDLTPTQVDVLNPSPRGENGFGSTGR